MQIRSESPLVTTGWLADSLEAPGLRIVDATWFLPGEAGDGWQSYLEAHLPGAVFFDIDAVSDPDSALPHMLPTEARFAEAAGSLGIDNDTTVVVYDARGLFSAARVWWMFRVFGHDDVAILDGGLPKWRREGRPLEQGEVTVEPRAFRARANPGLVRQRSALLSDIGDPRVQIVDARSAGRFRGAEPEPRAGLAGGHIPGSINIPFTEFLDPDAGTLLPGEQLSRLFLNHGVDLHRPVVTTCGSGITAAIPYLAATLMGAGQVHLYDGSWSEWGDPALDLPVARGDGSRAGSQ